MLLLLLVAAATPGAAVARGYQHALRSTRAYRQAEATLSHWGKKQEVWCTPLSGEVWPIQSVRRNFGQHNAAVESHITHIWLYHKMLPQPLLAYAYLTKLTCVFVISRQQQRKNR